MTLVFNSQEDGDEKLVKCNRHATGRSREVMWAQLNTFSCCNKSDRRQPKRKKNFTLLGSFFTVTSRGDYDLIQVGKKSTWPRRTPRFHAEEMRSSGDILVINLLWMPTLHTASTKTITEYFGRSISLFSVVLCPSWWNKTQNMDRKFLLRDEINPGTN